MFVVSLLFLPCHSFLLIPMYAAGGGGGSGVCWKRHESLFASSVDGNNKNKNNNVEEFNSSSNQNNRKRFQKWILLVDDDDSIRKAVGQFLFDQGYQVTACPDATTALQVAKQQQQQQQFRDTTTNNKKYPDLILSDVRMRPMDGIQFLQAIRDDKELQHIPVVLLSAKGSTQDRIRGYQAGADAYVPKPFDPQELLSICDNAIARFDALNGDSIQVDDLANDLEEIKTMLLQQGGRGVGNGWVEATNVFLAPDEKKLLELVAQGLTNAQVGEGLELSTRRVGDLLSALYKKTGVANRTELVRWAISTGNVKLT